tara:strand:+ start:661 stop:3537 length:2877 start_codon:yes stop_codon:yes gene_type:complete
MSTKYIASNWRLPNQENSSKSDNYGLDFDGSNEFINIGITPNSLVGSNNAYTVSAWVNPDISGNLNIIGAMDTSNRWYFRVLNGYASYAYGTATGDNGYNTEAATEVSLNVWSNIVFTFDGSTTHKIYINGDLKLTQSSGSGQTVTSTRNLYIGALNNNGSTQNYMNGSISELAVYDYALSSTQISTLYGSSSLGAGNPMALKPQPVAFYPLGDNSASNPLTQPNEAVEDASVFDFVSSSSQYIDCGDNDAFSFGNGTTDEAFSVSAWIKMDTITNFVVLSKYGASGSLREYAIGFSPDKIYLLLYDDNGAYRGRYYNTSTTSNDWMHITTTYNGVGGTNAQDGIKIYINGIRVDDSTFTSGSYTAMSNTTSELRIGSFSTTYADGKISNAQIWQAELSSTEVTTLYNSGVPLTGTQPQASNLKAWYKLDQSANWEADSSGNWQIPDAVSAYPQSFDFDGTSDIINFSTIDLGTTHTISMWVKITATSFANIITGTGGSQIKLNAPNKIYYYTNNYTNSQPSISMPLNQWNNIVIVRETTTIKFYVNNSLLHTTTSFAGDDFSFNKILGLDVNNQTSNIQLWDSALPATGTDSVETLYNNGVPLTTAIATDNLKLWAKLDNTATFSTNWSVPDASGNGNTGTSSGMTEQNLVNNNVSALNGESSGMTSANLVLSDLTRAVPYDSYSFNFDGVNDYINCGSASYLNGLSEFSLSCWFKLDTAASDRTIVSDWHYNNSPFGHFALQTIDASGSNYALYFFIKATSDGGGNWVKTSTILSENTWHNAVFTYNSGTVVCYIDSSSVSLTINGTIPTTLTNQDGNLNIGRFGGILDRYWDGEISNLSLFNKELTSTEVLKLYNSGVPSDLSNFNPSPIAWWTLGSNSFFNGSNYICRDLIGSNDGTSANAGVDAIVGDSPRSSANGVGTNNSIPENLEGSTKYSSNNSWSINMSETARVEDTP